MRNKRAFMGLILAVVVLGVDQLSKYWIVSIFNLPLKGSVLVFPGFRLTMVWNKAVTFGMLAHLGRYSPVIFAVVAALIVLALLIWMFRSRNSLSTIAIGAVIGGAIGNIIDRMRFGAVVDFIHLYAYGWSWYVFNVADCAIVCGVGLLLFDSLVCSRQTPVAHEKGME